MVLIWLLAAHFRRDFRHLREHVLVAHDFLLKLLQLRLGCLDLCHGRLKLLSHSLDIRLAVALFRLEGQLNFFAFTTALIQIADDLRPAARRRHSSPMHPAASALL